MVNDSQKRAIRTYRKRLLARGLARFEVLGLDTDRKLIRQLARRLATNDQDASRIRASVGASIAEGAPARGGILEALRRSPLVGVELDLRRPREAGRKIRL